MENKDKYLEVLDKLHNKYLEYGGRQRVHNSLVEFNRFARDGDKAVVGEKHHFRPKAHGATTGRDYRKFQQHRATGGGRREEYTDRLRQRWGAGTGQERRSC